MTPEEKRKLKNEDLIRRMKAGESLAMIDQSKTLFPPRPIIVKDKAALKRIFGDDNE